MAAASRAPMARMAVLSQESGVAAKTASTAAMKYEPGKLRRGMSSCEDEGWPGQGGRGQGLAEPDSRD